jgi:hypothetical protein
LKREFYRPSPRPSAAVVRVVGPAIEFSVSNAGDAPMTIIEALFAIDVKRDRDWDSSLYSLDIDYSGHSAVLKPNDVGLFSGRAMRIGEHAEAAPSTVHRRMTRPGDLFKCVLFVDVAEPDGRQRKVWSEPDERTCGSLSSDLLVYAVEHDLTDAASSETAPSKPRSVSPPAP